MNWDGVVAGRPEAFIAIVGVLFVLGLALFFFGALARALAEAAAVAFREGLAGWASKRHSLKGKTARCAGQDISKENTL